MYREKLKLDGEVAVVTGGGRAIGLACVTALADVDLAVAASGRAELHFLASSELVDAKARPWHDERVRAIRSGRITR